MELKDFVAETLRQVIDGVLDAQKHADSVGAAVNPASAHSKDNPRFLVGNYVYETITIIDFDVAVTTTESDVIKGGIGLFVGAVGVGTQGQAEDTNSTANRIKFSVPVMFPYQNVSGGQ